MDKKLIAVVGATGAQGSGLVRAILADPAGGFAVRALTRDPDSKKARDLAELGAEVVAADVSNPASLERAFKDAHGAFCITFFWEHYSGEKEKEHALNMARAAKTAGVKHVIWSTLEDTRRWLPIDDDRMPVLQGKYNVPHFDAKGEADQYFTELGLPVTFLVTSFYWDNLIHFGAGPQRGADGKLSFVLPMDDAKLPGIAAEDIGKCAYGIFKAGDKYIGRSVAISGEHLSGEEMAAELSKALGQPVSHGRVSPDVYRGFGFPGADEMGNMFQFKRDFESDFRGARDPSIARRLNPELQTFSQWLQKNASKIPIS